MSRSIKTHTIARKRLSSPQEEQPIALPIRPRIFDYLRRDEQVYDMFMESQRAPVKVEGPNNTMSLQ